LRYDLPHVIDEIPGFVYNLPVIEQDDMYLAKAQEALAGAQSEYANGRYNNCANRCYYSTFQATVFALGAEGIVPPDGGSGPWSHAGLQAEFARHLVNRRKRYPSELHATLLRNQSLRNTADDERHWVTEVQATRALRRTQGFLQAIRQGGTPA
jgi:uncharacterized protein (UPF0332 family)